MKRTIIREYDLKKLPKSVTKRYDIKFTPFTRQYFEKRVTYYSLKGKEYLVRQYMHYEYPESMIRRMTGFKLYDFNYKAWLCKYDEQGNMMIRAGLKQPESQLGFATFREKNNG
jgi:hypothetical protein